MSNCRIIPTAQTVHEFVFCVLTKLSVKRRTNKHANGLLFKLKLLKGSYIKTIFKFILNLLTPSGHYMYQQV